MLVAGFAVAAALTAAVPTSPGCIETVYEAAVVVTEMDAPVPDGWSVNIRCGERGRRLGAMNPVHKSLAIYMGRIDTDERLRHVFAHELGHAMDREYLNGERRDRWRSATGVDTPWWECDEGEPCANEEFANAVAECYAEGLGCEELHEAAFR